jgi:hypothetical protein
MLQKSLPNEMDGSEGKYSRSRKPIGQERAELESQKWVWVMVRGLLNMYIFVL